MVPLRFVLLTVCIASLSVAIKVRDVPQRLTDAVQWRQLRYHDGQPTAAVQWREGRFSLDAGSLDLWDDDQRGRAYFPFGHTGARKRLHDKVRRAKLDGTPLRIVTLGGSMTAGHGCPAPNYKQSGKPWPYALEALLKPILPTVSVTNLAAGGTTSTFALSNADIIMNATPDVVIVDYAINDCVGDTSDLTNADKGVRVQTAEVTRIQNITSKLIRLLLSMPTKPAVIYLETFTHKTLFGYTCAHRSSEFPHWDVLRNLEVPTVSYTEAICSSVDPRDSQSLLSSDMHNVWEDMYGNFGPHAKCWVHRGIAHLMAGFFMTSTRKALAMDAHEETDHPDTLLTVDAATSCALHPVMKHLAFVERRKILEKYFPAQPADGVWKFFEDAPGKPGWIAAPGPPGLISFDVETQGGAGAVVVMEYLTSYQNIGEATCWLDDDSHVSVKLNALRRERVSLFDTAVVELPANTTPGTHAFHCRSHGQKFKITSLRSC